jgi:hypothetical protein
LLLLDRSRCQLNHITVDLQSDLPIRPTINPVLDQSQHTAQGVSRLADADDQATQGSGVNAPGTRGRRAILRTQNVIYVKVKQLAAQLPRETVEFGCIRCIDCNLDLEVPKWIAPHGHHHLMTPTLASTMKP